jgi:hypothetical protein
MSSRSDRQARAREIKLAELERTIAQDVRQQRACYVRGGGSLTDLRLAEARRRLASALALIREGQAAADAGDGPAAVALIDAMLCEIPLHRSSRFMDELVQHLEAQQRRRSVKLSIVRSSK